MSRRPFRVRRASQIFNRLLKLTLGQMLKRMYNLEASNIEVLREVRPPYIVLPNHFTTWDPFLLGYLMPGPVYNVTSDVQFRSSIMRLLLGLVGGIPKSKVIPDLETVKSIFAVKQHKGIIGIYPEGKRSWDGHTTHILYSTAKLIKALKIPVIVPIMKGGYLSLPRWSSRRRRGRVSIEFHRALSPGEIRSMSVDSIYRRIEQLLSYDEFEFQRGAMVHYRGTRLAERLELVLFACPSCHRIATLASHGRRFGCSACGYTVHYNSYGFFDARVGELRFDTVRTWNVWQLAAFERLVAARIESGEEGPILSDENLLMLVGYRTRPLRRLHFGDMSLYVDRIEFKTLIRGTLVFPIAEIDGINVQIGERLEFYHRGVLYRFHSGRRIVSAFKWLSALEILQRLTLGRSTSEV